MKEHSVTLPEMALVAGTRVALGLGLGFLLADRLGHDSRRAAGWALFLVGLITTPMLAAEILGKGAPKPAEPELPRMSPDWAGV